LEKNGEKDVEAVIVATSLIARHQKTVALMMLHSINLELLFRSYSKGNWKFKLKIDLQMNWHSSLL
jgi:hypothetical protein